MHPGEHERRSKWQDERLDDLAELARSSDQRLDKLQNLVAVHDLQLIEMARDQRTRNEHRYTTTITLVAVLITSVLTLATGVITLIYH